MKLPWQVENLIWVEHRDRELDYARLLAHQLALAGLGSTVILSLPFHLPLGVLLSPRRVFVPFLRSQRDEGIAVLCRPPQQILSMNYEQLLGHFNREAKCPRLAGALHLYWYDAFGEILDGWNVPVDVRVRIPPPESRLVTRLARDQGWHRGRDGVLRDRVVFIPENYAWAFADSTTLRKKASAGFLIDQIERLRDYSADSLQRFAPELLATCKAHGDVAFVLRPHPSVSVEAYETELRRHGDLPVNLVISKNGSAWDWVGGSDAVISGWSTVTYSARQLGIPAALHHPLPLIPELDVPWVAAMPRFERLEAAVGHLLAVPPPAVTGYARSHSGFESLVKALREDPAPIDWPPRPHRARVLLRAIAATMVRMIGLVWRPSRWRTLSVYHADYFSPVRFAGAAHQGSTLHRTKG